MFFKAKSTWKCTGKQYFENLESSSSSQLRLRSWRISRYIAPPAGQSPYLQSPHNQHRKALDKAESQVRDSSLPSRDWIEPGGTSRGAPETNWTQLFGTTWHLRFSLQKHHHTCISVLRNIAIVWTSETVPGSWRLHRSPTAAPLRAQLPWVSCDLCLLRLHGCLSYQDK